MRFSHFIWKAGKLYVNLVSADDETDHRQETKLTVPRQVDSHLLETDVFEDFTTNYGAYVFQSSQPTGMIAACYFYACKGKTIRCHRVHEK